MFFDSMKNCFGSETDYSIEQDTAHRESRQVSEQPAASWDSSCRRWAAIKNCSDGPDTTPTQSVLVMVVAVQQSQNHRIGDICYLLAAPFTYGALCLWHPFACGTLLLVVPSD